MPTAPRNGLGSNQYVARGRGSERRAFDRAVVADAVDLEAEAVAWAFHPDADLWAAGGFPTWAEASPWMHAGWNPFSARVWRKAGWGPEGIHWLNHGFDAGGDTVITGNDARAWRDGGWRPETAPPWADLRFTPSSATEWKQAGFTATEAWEWVQEGFTETNGPTARWSPADAESWCAYEFDPKEAHLWNSSGWDPGQAASHQTIEFEQADVGAGPHPAYVPPSMD